MNYSDLTSQQWGLQTMLETNHVILYLGNRSRIGTCMIWSKLNTSEADIMTTGPFDSCAKKATGGLQPHLNYGANFYLESYAYGKANCDEETRTRLLKSRHVLRTNDHLDSNFFRRQIEVRPWGRQPGRRAK